MLALQRTRFWVFGSTDCVFDQIPAKSHFSSCTFMARLCGLSRSEYIDRQIAQCTQHNLSIHLLKNMRGYTFLFQSGDNVRDLG